MHTVVPRSHQGAPPSVVQPGQLRQPHEEGGLARPQAGLTLERQAAADLQQGEVVRRHAEPIGQRPDILSAEHTLLAANDDVGEARAEFFPKIQITAANGTASSGIKRLYRPGRGAWDIAP